MADLTPGIRSMTSMFIVDRGELLLLHRRGSRVIEDSWVGIGGHVEAHESSRPVDAALREIEEEVGITRDQLSDVRLRYIALRHVEHEIRQTFHFTATLKAGVVRPRACTEGELRWFDLDHDFSGLQMPATGRMVLDSWIGAGRHDDLVRFVTLHANGAATISPATNNLDQPTEWAVNGSVSARTNARPKDG